MKSNTVQILTTVLSNVAVLAGLVFLIFELRQNSAIALSQMTQERALAYIDQHVSYAANEDFAESITVADWKDLWVFRWMSNLANPV